MVCYQHLLTSRHFRTSHFADVQHLPDRVFCEAIELMKDLVKAEDSHVDEDEDDEQSSKTIINEEDENNLGVLPVLPPTLPPDKAFAVVAKLFLWYDLIELKERYHHKSCESSFLSHFAKLGSQSKAQFFQLLTIICPRKFWKTP